MPIKIQEKLPAQKILENENIFVMTENRAMHQDIRPLKVLVFNLMPTKIETETQILRKLSNSPLQVDVEFLQTTTYTPTHTDQEHLKHFYRKFDEIKNNKYDGVIITGAPIELMEFEDVIYWDELCKFMDWCETHVFCTFYLCWGAYAGLYYHYGIKKKKLEKKLFGVFKHRILKPYSPLFRGFDDIFYAPHSRQTDISIEDIKKIEDLEIMAVSDEAGVTIVKTKDSKKFFVTCHAEYDADTLSKEYFRDIEKGLNIDVPVNYFKDDNPNNAPIVTWRSTGQLLYTNWLNYYVYQSTPYDLNNLNDK